MELLLIGYLLEELHKMYASQNIITVIKLRTRRWAGHVARIGEMRCNFFCRKPEGKRPLGKPRRRWEDNIRMYLR
jgi:hypothetical protein